MLGGAAMSSGTHQRRPTEALDEPPDLASAVRFRRETRDRAFDPGKHALGQRAQIVVGQRASEGVAISRSRSSRSLAEEAERLERRRVVAARASPQAQAIPRSARARRDRGDRAAASPGCSSAQVGASCGCATGSVTHAFSPYHASSRNTGTGRVLLVPRATGRAEDVDGQAVQLARLVRVVDGGKRATERKQDSGELAVLELAPQLVKPITQRVPIAHRPISSGSVRSPADPPARDTASVTPSTRGRGQEALPGVCIVAQLVDHEVAPARVHPTDPERGDPEEVIGQPVDELAHAVG